MTYHFQTLSQTCRELKSGALTSVKLTEYMLERIQSLDPGLKSYARVLGDTALEEARALDEKQQAGEPLRLLHGVPIAIKDLLFTKGVPTASGTRVMADFRPQYDATVVERLRAAGAVIIGKTQLTEGAFGAHHPSIDPPRNPYNQTHWPGVSSSGSGVSVAAGMNFGALGTDTGGSIRFPSACCGLVGIKPTYGRVSRHGAFALAESLDHIGPMARTVEDAARILTAIAGRDENDETSLHAEVPDYHGQLREGLDGVKIGIDRAYASNGVDQLVKSNLENVVARLTELGATIEEVQLPPAYTDLVEQWGITCGVECARAHEGYFPEQADLYGPVLKGLLDMALQVDPAQYQEIETIRSAFTRDLEALLNQVDCLLTPVMTSLPPLVEEMDQTVAQDDARAAFITFTAPFDYSGHPTITMPNGLSDEGLPLSFQLVGRHLGESSLVSFGSAYESAFGTMPHPPVD